MNDKAAPLLAVNNIEVIYDHVILVLRGVSLHVPKGDIVALLGANGAGKTTTLKSISNLLHSERGEVTKGTIEYQGKHIENLTPADLVKRGVIHVMEGRQIILALLHKSVNRIVPCFERQICGEHPRHTQTSRLGCSPEIYPQMLVQDDLSDLCNNAEICVTFYKASCKSASTLRCICQFLLQ